MKGVACFTDTIRGYVSFHDTVHGCKVIVNLTHIPPGKHGFHIHAGGDLRGKGCMGACDHYHVGKKTTHGGDPSTEGPRHTGDLGNITGPRCKKQYLLNNVRVADLFGRSVILHKDEDDLGLGPHDDSRTTGHSGKRIACAIIGRVVCTQRRRRPRTQTKSNV